MKSYVEARLRLSTWLSSDGGRSSARLTNFLQCLPGRRLAGARSPIFPSVDKRLQQSAIRLVDIVAPENKDHFLDLALGREKFAGCFQRNLRRFLNGIAIGAATDRRKRYGLDSVFHCNLQRISIAICQRLSFAVCPAAPDRPDRVNDELSGQTIGASNFRFAGSTTAECPAFHEQVRAGRAMNRAIDSSAAEKRCVRRVHNSIDIELRDVAAVDFELAIGILHEEF